MKQSGISNPTRKQEALGSHAPSDKDLIAAAATVSPQSEPYGKIVEKLVHNRVNETTIKQQVEIDYMQFCPRKGT